MCECDGNFFFVAAGDAVREDVDVIAALYEIERGLKDAHVGLDRGQRKKGGLARLTSIPKSTTEVICGRSRKRVFTSGIIIEKRAFSIVATCRSASEARSISGLVWPRAAS